MENRITYPVSADNSIEQPDWFRQKYGIKPGDEIRLLETDAGLLVAPQTELAMQLVDRIGEGLQAKGITLEQLMDDGRQIRGDMLRKEYGIEAE